MSADTALVAAQWSDLAPLARRAADLDPAAIVRMQVRADLTLLWARPFDVLAGRRVRRSGDQTVENLDRAVLAADLVAWVDGTRSEPPGRMDFGWHATLPPENGWRRLDRVPDGVIRDLVRTGALEIKRLQAEGTGTAARTEQALLDAIVLTVTDGPAEVDAAPQRPSARVALRVVAALTRLGFLARGGEVAVDVTPRWIRLAAQYGSVYAERPGTGLTVL